jgi:hypothetical protein
VQGTREGITTAVEMTREALSATGDRVKAFTREDLASTKKDIEAVEELLLSLFAGLPAVPGK